MENIVAFLGSEGQVIRVCTVFRRPESERWDAEEILKIRATPRRPNPLNVEQEEPTSVSETVGFEIRGDGSKLLDSSARAQHNQKHRFSNLI